jgi:hypothetical protein
MSAAKAALTRFTKVGSTERISCESRNELAIAESNYFHAEIEKQETKRNLLSGKEFTQPVNTPLCCDPSSETYHSM